MRTYKIWEHSSWGNAINLQFHNGRATNRIYGHMSYPNIEDNDILILRADNGIEVKCKIHNVEYKRDPQDMFYAYIKMIKDPSEYSWWEKFLNKRFGKEIYVSVTPIK